MASDNTTLNAGSGGNTLRTLADASSIEWPASVLCYATTISAGANVLQVVTPSAPLPVSAAQSGTWTVNPEDPAATTGYINVVDGSVGTSTGQGGQTLLTGTPTAGSSLAATLSAHAMVTIQVTGTWSGALSFERSVDGGATYVPMSLLLYGVGGPALGSITANAVLHTTVGGDTQVRVRATAPMTGNATVRIQPGYGEAVSVALAAGLNTQQSGALTGTPLYAKIAASASGATTIVGATAGKEIVILRWSLSANGQVQANWQSHTTTATATGLHYMTQYSTAGGAYCPAGIFATVAGEALDLNLSAAVAVGGELTYFLM